MPLSLRVPVIIDHRILGTSFFNCCHSCLHRTGGSGAAGKPLVERLFGDANKPAQMQHAEIRRMAAKIIGASLADAEDLCDLHDRVGFLLHFLVLYHVVIHICPSCGSTHAPHKPLYASLLQISDYWQVYYSNIRYKCKDAEFLVQIKFNNFCKRGIIHLSP